MDLDFLHIDFNLFFIFAPFGSIEMALWHDFRMIVRDFVSREPKKIKNRPKGNSN